MNRSYDFSPLDAPLSAAESAGRRREMLGGRSVLRELDLTRGILLLGMVLFVWPMLLLSILTVVGTIISWVIWNGPTADWGFGAPIVLLGILVAIGAVVVATRLLLIPPAWGRWVRMHRFAEVNGMTFQRGVAGGPATGVPGFGEQQVLSDVFSDPVSGIVLGNAGVGAGSQAFILARAEGSGLAPIEAQVLDGFTVRETPDGRLATRYRSVQMRDSVTVRRMFATADRILEADFDAIR